MVVCWPHKGWRPGYPVISRPASLARLQACDPRLGIGGIAKCKRPTPRAREKVKGEGDRRREESTTRCCSRSLGAWGKPPSRPLAAQTRSQTVFRPERPWMPTRHVCEWRRMSRPAAQQEPRVVQGRLWWEKTEPRPPLASSEVAEEAGAAPRWKREVVPLKVVRGR